MQLLIGPGIIISELQKSFSEQFPFLKLEFFKKEEKRLKKQVAPVPVPGHTKMGELNAAIKEDNVELDNNTKVSELETLFTQKLETPVQVFRRSGNLWLETTMTDDWTLQRQNEHGRELSVPLSPEKNTDFDLDRDAGH